MKNRLHSNHLYCAGMIAAAAMATSAQAERKIRHFDVAAQELSQALLRLSAQSGQQIMFVRDDIAGHRSNPVSGDYSPDEALNRMIRGLPIRKTVTQDGIFLLKLAQRDPTPSPSDKPAAQPARDAQAPAAPAAIAPDMAGDIVVTAQKREQRLQDVPVSVTVADGNFLRQANIGNLADLSTRLPGVRLTPAPGANLLFIRGVGSGLNAGFEQAVGTFVDGLYRGRSRSSNAGLFDLERIEVLKGPQTTFFGNNVIAGALNIVTRKPGDRLSYNGSALYAPADGEYAVEGGITVPLGEGLSARLAGRAAGMDGYLYNETTKEKVPHQRGLLFRGSVAWQPSSSWRTDARIDWGRQRNRGEPATEGVNCPPDPAYGAPRGTCLRYLNSGQPLDTRFDYHLNNFTTRTHYDYIEAEISNSIEAGPGTLSAISGYFHHKALNLNDLAPFPVGGLGGTASGTISNNFERMTQYSQEIRYASPQDLSFSYMFGGYYAREEIRTTTYAGFYFSPFGSFAAPVYNANTPIGYLTHLNQNTDNLSAFASLSIRPSETIQADFGLRYSHVDKKAFRDLVYGEGGYIPGPGAFTAGPASVQTPLAAVFGAVLGNFPRPKRTDHKLMPSLKLQYKPASDIMAYASYNKGFKAGGFSATPGRDIFEAESVDAYELGMKGSFFDRRLFLSLAAFRSDYSNLQETTQVPTASGAIVSVVTNAAKARAQGLEAGGRVRISPNLSINADVSYLNAEYRNYPSAPCTILGGLVANCKQDMSGRKRGFSPKFSGNVGASFRATLTEAVDLRIDPSVYFSSRYFQSATADPLLSQKGYAKIDLRAAVGPGDQRWEIAVVGKNITDKRTAAFRQPFAGAPGSIFLFPERPRSVAVQASMKY